MTWFGVPAHMSLYILLGTLFLIGSYFVATFLFSVLGISNSFLQAVIALMIVGLVVRLFVFITKRTWKQSDWDR